MKKIIFLLLFLPMFGAAQSGILNRVKQKVKDRAEQRIDQGIDKSLDKTEEELAGKGKQKGDAKEEKNDVVKTAAVQEAPAAPAFESYSRYDFVPGANVVYAEDFSQDVVGEFPLLWSTNNRGEVVTIKSQQGKWLRMFHGSHFIAPQLKRLPDNFTAEFDMVMTFTKEGYVYPAIFFKLLQAAEGDKDGRQYLSDVHGVTQTSFRIAPGEEESSTIELNTFHEGGTYFHSGEKGLKKLDAQFGKTIHVAMWVQKTRIRMWMNGEKIYDIPQAVPTNTTFNRLALEVTGSNYEDEQVGVYLTNIRIAEGAADVRNKLLTEGKWVTHGILFDVASDKIKPESAGVLKEIADILKENSSLKVKIVGHTDSDGDESKNLDLSKRRAASVKQALSKDFGIDAGRLQTDGLGETAPVKANTTKEGKAQNRRVEFIKL
jgi:OmpA-OmpF porin, OOP family